MVENEEEIFVLTKVMNRPHMCIDYKKLNLTTQKDHFPLPFISQILKHIISHPFYCFLGGYFGYYQIGITIKD